MYKNLYGAVKFDFIFVPDDWESDVKLLNDR